MVLGVFLKRPERGSYGGDRRVWLLVGGKTGISSKNHGWVHDSTWTGTKIG
jgi:hypothetical protein